MPPVQGNPTKVSGPFIAEIHLADGTTLNLERGEFAPGADGRLTPVREPAVRQGQRNMPGLWFSSLMRRHVSYESLLERNRMLLLDFDPSIRNYLEQPFRLHYKVNGRSRVHTPDLLVWRTDGSLMICNVKSTARLERGSFPAQSEACAQFCRQERIDYSVLTEPDGQQLENLRWLSGYWGVQLESSPAFYVMEGILKEGPRSVQDLLHEAGGHEATSRPVLFAALWSRRFLIDLDSAIESDSNVWISNAD